MEKLRFWTVEILLVSLIIYVFTKISFIFNPIAVFVSTLFFPILIAGFLFFVLNPIKDFLMRRGVPKVVAIISIYIVMIGLLTLLGAAIGPQVYNQIVSLGKSAPNLVKQLKSAIDSVSNSSYFDWIMKQEFLSIENIEQKLVDFTSSFVGNFSNSLSAVVSFVANLTLIVITVPFVLFYMLKDGHRLPDQLLRFVPKNYHGEARKIINETGDTLASYIQGQMIVCLFVALGNTIGYLILGLDYALLFGIMIGILNIIPYVGPWIGAAPAVIVGFIDSPIKAVLVILVIVVVQQLDGNVISPLVIGKKLELHPLMIIILLLVAGNLAGVVGMVLAVPTYAVSRTIIQNFYRIWKLRRV